MDYRVCGGGETGIYVKGNRGGGVTGNVVQGKRMMGGN